ASLYFHRGGAVADFDDLFSITTLLNEEPPFFLVRTGCTRWLVYQRHPTATAPCGHIALLVVCARAVDATLNKRWYDHLACNGFAAGHNHRNGAAAFVDLVNGYFFDTINNALPTA